MRARTLSLVGGLAMVAACSGSGHPKPASTSSGSSTTSTTAASKLGGAAAELIDLLTRGNQRTFHARYGITSASTAGASVTLELWRQPPLVRQDTVIAQGAQANATSVFQLASGIVQCTRQGAGPWSCQPATTNGAGLADLSTLTQRITAQLANATVSGRDDSVGGRPARCFTINLDNVTTDVCVDHDGVPLREASGGSSLDLQTLDADVPAGTFTPPVPVG